MTDTAVITTIWIEQTIIDFEGTTKNRGADLCSAWFCKVKPLLNGEQKEITLWSRNQSRKVPQIIYDQLSHA
jgi:hypothetical protein